MTRRALIIVENLPVPFDRRVWQEATSLKRAGWDVAVICPKGKGHDVAYEELQGIHIYRHPLPLEASGALGFLAEYSAALFWEFVLSVKIIRRHGFDLIHGCNPPDLIFLVALFYKLFFGKRFLFDHHDITPELYEAKFQKRGPLHTLMRVFEWCTFKCADASIATNDSFKEIAVRRGGMAPDRVWVVKSYPDLSRFLRLPPDPALKRGRPILVGYVGIMGKQDGVDRLVAAMDHIVRVKGRDDIGCAIIGEGPEVPRLLAMTRDQGLEAQVEFTGYLSGETLLTHLSTLDIGVIPDPPNSYNDKISMNKVFEYMGLGIPFVQYDLAESRTTAGEAASIVSEDTGAALGDAIIALADDPGRRERMAAFGTSHSAANFSWDREQDTLLAAYDSLMPAVEPRARDAGKGPADRTRGDRHV